MSLFRSVLTSIEPLTKTLAKTHLVSIIIVDNKKTKLLKVGSESVLQTDSCINALWESALNQKSISFDRIIDSHFISSTKLYDNENNMCMLISMSRTKESALSDELQNELLDSLARTVQSCIQWSGTQRSAILELMEKYEELTLLYDISERLGALPSFDEVANEMLKEATSRVKCKAGRLVLVEEDGSYQERLFANKDSLISQSSIIYHGSQDPASFCLEKPVTQIVNDPTKDNGLSSLTQLHVPVCLKDTPIGVLSLFRLLNSPFKNSDKKIAEMLARQTAGKLESSRLYAKLEMLFMDSIKMLVECIDARDTYTSGHSSRVSIYSVFLAREIGLPEDQVKTIEIGALLHDVGKIRIRDHILNKPGRLTDEERHIIQQHPEFGMRIVEHIKQLHNTVPCIYCHHEYFDGKGYPRGLGGEDIPLMGRIVTIADTFDAMTSTRPYRKALSQKQAFDEIIKFKGLQFDPHLAEVFGEAIIRGEFDKYIETDTITTQQAQA
ncbi:MAG: HD domain-containing protein [Acidobacteria bacterium]|nr:HD domain-containing protein [Acidobacteriota bacterium]